MSDETKNFEVTLPRELAERVEMIVFQYRGKKTVSDVVRFALVHGLETVEEKAQSFASRNVVECPRCEERNLGRFEDDGIRLIACQSCAGIWMDNESGKRLIERPNKKVLRLAQGMDDDVLTTISSEQPVRCPVCAEMTAATRFPHTPARLYLCPAHGTWFDQHNMVEVVLALEKRTSVPPAPA